MQFAILHQHLELRFVHAHFGSQHGTPHGCDGFEVVALIGALYRGTDVHTQRAARGVPRLTVQAACEALAFGLGTLRP